jgi:hypothetical protein
VLPTMMTSRIKELPTTLVALEDTRKTMAEDTVGATLTTTITNTKTNTILNNMEAMVDSHTTWATKTTSTNAVDTVLVAWAIHTVCSRAVEVINLVELTRLETSKTMIKRERREDEETEILPCNNFSSKRLRPDLDCLVKLVKDLNQLLPPPLEPADGPTKLEDGAEAVHRAGKAAKQNISERSLLLALT